MKNIAKAAYCRTYQLGFRTALPLLPYREPEILENTAAIAEICSKKDIKSVLIITDKGIMGAGLIEPLRNALSAAGIGSHVFDETVPNPTIDNIEAALSVYMAEGCSAIVGFGGGSSMDCAKVVAARAAKPYQSVQQMKGILRIHHSIPLLFAVPTTAGTGSETTVAAVITDASTHHKYPINDFCLIPRYAVLDPQVTASLPKHLTATTGMDALTHAVEAYIGNTTTPKTRVYAEEAVTLIYENIEKAYNDGSDLEARRNMLLASYKAGFAFSMSYVGYVHAVAHSLGGQYGVPHGLANAVILPYFLLHYGKRLDPKLARLARKAGMVPQNTPDKKAASAFRTWVKEANRRMDIPKQIPQIQIKDIPIMADHADKEANPLYPVPVLMDKDELAAMYYLIKGEE